MDISTKALEYAKKKAEQASVKINFMLQSFVDLPFGDAEFDFVFDMGCFHHVEVEDRHNFIRGVHRVLKNGGVYLLTCFSYKNGPAWNHFTKKQLIDLFSDCFEWNEFRHASSIEGDGVRRFFYTVLMKKKSVQAKL
jgi:ubiquinone/menaquinone biosynthesis C-methylase UbiE